MVRRRPLKAQELPRIWYYKTNSTNQPYQSGWGDWKRVFESRQPREWGGTWCTKHPTSRKIFEEDLRKGDLVVCYQTDRREILGICRVVGFKNRPRGSKKGRNVMLRPIEEFPSPVKIHALKQELRELREIRALKPGPMMAIQELNKKEASLLLSVCKSRFAQRFAGVDSVQVQEDAATPSGGGFGSAEENAEVERRAIEYVRRRYQRKGWHVTSRETENTGYDLECTKGRQVRHVEVKGLSGTGDSLLVTRREYQRMKRDRQFRLAIVANALSRRPRYESYTGRKARRIFEFTPIQYMARRKRP